jgi:hypothetical protein
MNLGERWPPRLVATAAEDCLKFWRAQSADPKCGGDGLRSFTANKNHAPAEEAELRLVQEPVAIAAAPETCPPLAVPGLV